MFADEKEKVITDDLDQSACQLCLVKGHAVAASVRINSTRTTKVSEALASRFQLAKFSKFRPGNISLTSRLVVWDDDSPGQLTAVLFGAAYKVARNMGSRFDFSSCPPPLVLFTSASVTAATPTTSSTKTRSIRYPSFC